ncbi:MAG: hypothetical protein JWO22_3908 [Frankiales bacterium]|nr:hypothetical protein [Frankiales bacterium]
MNDDLLRDALAHRADPLPAESEVLANADRLARRYRRRRRTAQATTGAVLGVGLVAGAVDLPSLFHSDPATPQTQLFGAQPTPTPTHSDDQALTEYFNDGYDYRNAVDLARLWHETDIGATKVEAGHKLLDGETLPVKPAGQPASPADKDADQATSAFFNAGYTYDDAVELGKKWNLPDTYQVKVKAGHKVENGETLPVQPSGK